MTTAWSHLPNAVHIDRVIASAKAHPKAWEAAWDDAARDAARAPAWDEAREAAWYHAGAAAWVAAGHAERPAAWNAVLALAAWDHSAKFLDMTSNELKMWWELSEDPACILLLPAVVAFEQINEFELA